MSWDIFFLQLLNNLPNYWLGWKIAAIFAAEVLVWLLLAWYLVAFIRTKHKNIEELIVSALGAGSLLLFNNLVPLWWWRPRPFVSGLADLFISQPFSLKSFPSDHAALAFFFSYLLFKHNHSGWAFGLAVVVALGRVIVGVHYPFDVLAGAVIGLVFGFFTSEAMNIFKPRVLGSRVN